MAGAAEPLSSEIVSRIKQIVNENKENEEQLAKIAKLLAFLLNKKSNDREFYHSILESCLPNDDLFRRVVEILCDYCPTDWNLTLFSKSDERIWFMSVFVFSLARLLNVSTAKVMATLLKGSMTSEVINESISTFFLQTVGEELLTKLSPTEAQAFALLVHFIFNDLIPNVRRCTSGEMSYERFKWIAVDRCVELAAGFGGQLLGEKLANELKPGICTLIGGAVVGVTLSKASLALYDRIIRNIWLGSNAFNYLDLPITASNNDINEKILRKRMILFRKEANGENNISEDLEEWATHNDRIKKFKRQ